MLKLIDPVLTPDLLYALRAMGHGDEIALCDTNFPADAVARHTVTGRALRLDSISLARAVKAVLSLMPLDTFVDVPARRMEVVGKPDEVPAVLTEVQREIDAAEGRSVVMGSIERFAFYEAAKRAYCLVLTGERRFYGNVILRMGVIPPET